jgi:hypothetical protein
MAACRGNYSHGIVRLCLALRPHEVRMLNGRRRRAIAIALGVLAAGALLPGTAARGAQTPATSERESLWAWEEIATVLQNPRCLNCHQLRAPLQGDAWRIHVPRVVRGPDGHGVSAMRCGNCHNEMGNNPTSGAPGGLTGSSHRFRCFGRGVGRRSVPDAQEPKTQWQPDAAGAR